MSSMHRTSESQPPAKRARHSSSLSSQSSSAGRASTSSAPTSTSSLESHSSSSSSVTVKKERYKTPELTFSSQPVKTGSRYYKMPPECDKSVPNYSENRSEFYLRKKMELKRQALPGFEITKAMWRPDGLAIDWKSTIPVLADTLRPPGGNLVTALNTASQANALSLGQALESSPRPVNSTSSQHITSGVAVSPQRSTNKRKTKRTPSLAKALPSPRPAPSTVIDDSIWLEEQSSTVSLEALTRPAQPPIETNFASSSAGRPPAPNQGPSRSSPTVAASTARPSSSASLPSNLSSDSNFQLPKYDTPCTDYGLVEDWPTKDESQQVSETAIQFLNRYILLWDGDRAKLVNAYGKDAFFSRRRIVCTAESMMSLTGSKDALVHGRTEVVAALRDIGSLQIFKDGVAERIVYDVSHLGRIGTLLTVRGSFYELRAGKTTEVPFTWAFVLRSCSNEELVASEDETDAWPLVVISHQMLIYRLA
ncbi:hypothetical protein K488DRAFT_88982 [Vararia minispora EC-137]|uniref:Uncharacterized protein n=1 Tax=Vararia minispora EC-137 TaxID=1314806 RepID=A0ACB8QBX8_9AGAM|nr:hypothetical protein K488DRAFT_88982 [Vararia minispora EC-137]